MKPAIFLDRDGVIIANRTHYVRRWRDVAIYPQAQAALMRLSKAAYPLVIVTNQSAIGRGIISLAQAEAINARLLEILRTSGARIEGVYLCPHAPADNCNCRKPRPGLLLQAAADLHLDLSASVLIGDALSDLEAGQAAGVARTMLVKTGRGKEQLFLPRALELPPFEVCDDLSAAVDLLLASGSLG